MIKNLIFSFFDITRNIIFAKRAKVLFYYPQHFNRSNKGTNPFYDTLLKVCDENRISYKLIEEPGEKDLPRNEKAIKGDAFLWLIIIIRKIIRIVFRKNDFYNNEIIVAHIVNILTLGRLRYNNYITISGSMFHLLPHLQEGSDVYDLQHGILFKGHYVFFDQKNNERLFPHFYPKNFHWLFWGEGYKNCFIRGDEEYMKGKAHVIGYPIKSSSQIQECPHFTEYRVILVSLQITSDWNIEKYEEIQKMIVSLLEDLKGQNIKVFFKHHPRYNNELDISALYEKYDFTRETKEDLQELLSKAFLQVTFTSTTAFEFAEAGIPSFFLSDSNYPQSENTFYKEYKYPLYAGMGIIDVVTRLKDKNLYILDSKTVKDWYDKFYSPFNEREFLKIIQ